MTGYSGYSIYLQAHQDDFQLFVGEQAFADCNSPGLKVVFITLTAGDAGTVNGWWQSREEGSKASISFISNNNIFKEPSRTISSINGHSIAKFTFAGGRVVSYYLRLPDGNRSGQGWATTGYQSMQKLREGTISSLNTVNSTSSYSSWDDLKNTVSTIMLNEKPSNISIPWVFVSNPDLKENYGDHSDHHHAALLIYDTPGYNKSFYLTYCMRDKSPNLSGTALMNKQTNYFQYLTKTCYCYQFDIVNNILTEWNVWGTKSYQTISLDPNSPKSALNQLLSTQNSKNDLNYHASNSLSLNNTNNNTNNTNNNNNIKESCKKNSNNISSKLINLEDPDLSDFAII